MTDKTPNPPGPPPLPFEFPPDLKLEYTNLVRIAHSAAELVFDFALLLPGMTSATVSSRIVMSTLSAKLFYRALGENLAKYEATFGEIHIPGEMTLAEHLFRPPTSPEQPPQP
jgi:hypothetical protein